MLHACVQKFDVTNTVQNFLGTKQGLSFTLRALVKQTSSDTFADAILGQQGGFLLRQFGLSLSKGRMYSTHLSQFNLNISETNKKKSSQVWRNHATPVIISPKSIHFLSSYFQSHQDSSLVAWCTHRQRRAAGASLSGRAARCRANASFHGCGAVALATWSTATARRLLDCSADKQRARGILRILFDPLGELKPEMMIFFLFRSAGVVAVAQGEALVETLTRWQVQSNWPALPWVCLLKKLLLLPSTFSRYYTVDV